MWIFTGKKNEMRVIKQEINISTNIFVINFLKTLFLYRYKWCMIIIDFNY